MLTQSESVQLTIDDYVCEADPTTVHKLKSAMEKRDSKINELTKQLERNDMKEYKVGDKVKTYTDMDALYKDMSGLYTDMENKYLDMCQKMTDMGDKYKEDMEKLTSEKQDSKESEIESLKEAIATLEGKNEGLEVELSKRLDSDDVQQKVKERCQLISKVERILKLDSKSLVDLSEKEIKIKAIASNNSIPENELLERSDSYIDGAFEIALRYNGDSTYVGERKKIEGITTKQNEKRDSKDQMSFAERITRKSFEKLQGKQKRG